MRRKEWNWDEYDEIWGFEEVPRDFPDYQTHAEALEDRKERGVPTQIEDQDLPEFHAIMDMRRESRQRRGLNRLGGTIGSDT
eukprot:13803033-Heterocapsa_arctica.AAC.1